MKFDKLCEKYLKSYKVPTGVLEVFTLPVGSQELDEMEGVRFGTVGKTVYFWNGYNCTHFIAQKRIGVKFEHTVEWDSNDPKGFFLSTTGPQTPLFRNEVDAAMSYKEVSFYKAVMLIQKSFPMIKGFASATGDIKI